MRVAIDTPGAGAGPATGSGAGLSRRRFLTCVIAAPTLTVAVRAADRFGGPLTAWAPQPAGASTTPSDIVDLSDALTLAALPTAYLLVIEITTDGRAVVHVPRA
jgi:isoquinoline 1-oxidoreductase beta subunit